MSKRLVGADGKLQVGTFGTEVTTGTLTADTWYLVTAIGTSSVLPSGAVVGYLYKSDGTEDLTGSGGDGVKPWNGTDMCDIQNWSLDLSRAEADVTVMCDNVKVYRAGKTDITGNTDGVFTTEITTKDGGFLNNFIDIVKQDPSQSDPDDYKIHLADDAVIMSFLYLDKSSESAEHEVFYYAPITLTGFSSSAGGEEAQTFSAPFRIAPSQAGEAVFALYEYAN